MDQWEPIPQRRPWGMTRRLAWIAGALAATYASSYILRALVPILHPNAMLLQAMWDALMVVITLGCALLDRDGVGELGLVRPWKGYDAAVMVGIVVMHFVISFTIPVILLAIHKESALQGQEINNFLGSFTAYQFGPFLLMAAGLTALVAVAEELLFRGYIITRLEKAGLPGWLCILASAAIFTAVHVRGYGILLALPKIGLGLMFAAFYWYRRNLGPLIVAHFFIDFSSFALSYLAGLWSK